MNTTQQTVSSIKKNVGEMTKESPEFMKAFMGLVKNAEKEMEERDNFQHLIVNDHLEDAISQLVAIIKSHGDVPEC